MTTSAPSAPAEAAPVANGTSARNLWQRMAAVAAELQVTRTGRMDSSAGKYPYTKYDDVAEALRPVLARHGVALMVHQKAASIAPAKTSGGKDTWRATVELEIGFVNVDEPSEREIAHWSNVADDAGDKAISKAQTVALKTFLMKKFLTPGDEDPDGTPSGDSRHSAAPPAQPPAAAPPVAPAAGSTPGRQAYGRLYTELGIDRRDEAAAKRVGEILRGMDIHDLEKLAEPSMYAAAVHAVRTLFTAEAPPAAPAPAVPPAQPASTPPPASEPPPPAPAAPVNTPSAEPQPGTQPRDWGQQARYVIQVPSQSRPGVLHDVALERRGHALTAVCPCDGFTYRRHCRHIPIAWRELALKCSLDAALEPYWLGVDFEFQAQVAEDQLKRATAEQGAPA